MNDGQNGTKFPLGLEDWEAGRRRAIECVSFVPDVEEEQIADEPRSCYNCRYRRWLADSIVCLAIPASALNILA